MRKLTWLAGLTILAASALIMVYVGIDPNEGKIPEETFQTVDTALHAKTLEVIVHANHASKRSSLLLFGTLDLAGLNSELGWGECGKLLLVFLLLLRCLLCLECCCLGDLRCLRRLLFGHCVPWW